jgi:hypothetical protein
MDDTQATSRNGRYRESSAGPIGPNHRAPDDDWKGHDLKLIFYSADSQVIEHA